MLFYGLFLNMIFVFFNYQPVINSDNNLSLKVVKKTHKISHAPKVINKVYQYIYIYIYISLELNGVGSNK